MSIVLSIIKWETENKIYYKKKRNLFNQVLQFYINIEPSSACKFIEKNKVVFDKRNIEIIKT